MVADIFRFKNGEPARTPAKHFMGEDEKTLYELMFHAEQFCLRVESAVADAAPAAGEDEELRLKVGYCRNLLQELQVAFENDILKIQNVAVRANFRQLIIALLWIAFRARRVITFQQYRMLIMIESGFTYLLAKRR